MMKPPADDGEHMDRRPSKPGPEYEFYIEHYRRDQNPITDDPYWWYFKTEQEALNSNWENWSDAEGGKYRCMLLRYKDLTIKPLRG